MLQIKAGNTIKQYRMLRKGGRVLVALSGGPDSVALLHFLLSYPKIKVSAAHFNHMVRKGGAERDEEFVRNICKKWGVTIFTGKENVPLCAKKNKMTIEEAARVLRYEFLETTAKKIKASRIAVGHNSDDNVETFLIRLIRGTGLKGLRAIPPVNGKIVRPLIDVSRREILVYCKKNRIRFVHDATNDDTKYTRNWVRKELLPSLTKLRKNIRPQILGLIKAVNKEYKSVERVAQKALKAAAVSVSRNKMLIDLKKVLKMPEALRPYVLRAAIEKVKGDLKDIYKVHIENVLNLKNGWLNLPDGMFAFKDGKILSITKEGPEIKKTKQFKYMLNIPGKIRVKESRSILEAVFAPKMPATDKIGKNEAFIDADKLSGKVLAVRNYRKGDRFVPFGMKGHKKLHDFFIDEKIPSGARCRVPVVCDKKKIVWVAGYRVDDRVKISKRTSRIVKLNML